MLSRLRKAWLAQIRPVGRICWHEHGLIEVAPAISVNRLMPNTYLQQTEHACQQHQAGMYGTADILMHDSCDASFKHHFVA